MAAIEPHNTGFLHRIISIQSAVLVGVSIRLLFFVLDDSLWKDEAKLLMGLHSVSFGELFHELPFGQRSPIALALLWKWMAENFIGTTYLMRLPSLAASIAQLLLFAIIIQKIANAFDDDQPKLFVWLAAVAPNLILFSNQVKPYIFDVFVSTLLIGVALPFLLRENEKIKRSQSILLVSISWVSFFFSYPAAFVVGGICTGLLVHYGFKKLGLLSAMSIGSLMIMIFIFKASGDSSEYLQNFWQGAYVRANLNWWRTALSQSVFFGLASPNYLPPYRLALFFGWLFYPLCILGVLALMRMKKIGLLTILTLPSLFCLFASGFHKYPYHGRLILFMLPQLFILLAFGSIYVRSKLKTDGHTAFDFVNRSVGKTHATICSVLGYASQWGSAAIVLLCCIVSIVEYSYPCKGIRSGLEYIAHREKTGDIVVADLNAAQVVEYYRVLSEKDQSRKFPHAKIVIPWPDETERAGRFQYKMMADRLPSQSRIWIIAEAQGYYRYLTTSSLPVVDKMVGTLLQTRKKICQMKIPRIFVVCLSEEYK